MGGEIFRSPRMGRRDGADQLAQRARLLPQRFFVRPRPDRGAENPQFETAVRHLSLPDHPWRRDHAAARDDADYRPYPDRQHSLAQRTGWRGTELYVAVRW